MVSLFCVMSQINESTDFTELANKETWLSSSKLVVKPDMLFGKRGKSGLVALNLNYTQVATFVKERLGKEVNIFFLSFASLFDILVFHLSSKVHGSYK